MTHTPARPVAGLAILALTAVGLSACATAPEVVCSMPESRHLDTAIASAKRSLATGCENHFHAYLSQLLAVAEGDPRPENKRAFSDFLVWAGDQGLLARRQTEELYNRYFNVKFVSLMGDYNNCSYTCPRQDALLDKMQDELADKELGLLKVSQDTAAYYRADRLFAETELVLAAMCSACEAGT